MFRKLQYQITIISSLLVWKNVSFVEYQIQYSARFTAWKVSVFGVILVWIFMHLDWIRRYWTRRTPTTDTLYAVVVWLIRCWENGNFSKTDLNIQILFNLVGILWCKSELQNSDSCSIDATEPSSNIPKSLYAKYC